MNYLNVKTVIRWGSRPNHPKILYAYLSDCEEAALVATPAVGREILNGAVELLVEVICDACVPFHWRALCLDNLYKPMGCLRRIATCSDDTLRVNKLAYEINLLTKFFLTN